MQIKTLTDTAVEMIEVSASTLRRKGRQDAQELAELAIIDLCTHFGGAPHYLGRRNGGRHLEDGKFPDHFPDVSQRMVLRMEAALSEKVDAAQARSLSLEIVLALVSLFCGRPVYIPRNDAMKRAARITNIVADQGKLSVRQLAEKHGVCVQTIYKILSEYRKDLKRNRESLERGGL